jgi:hypothetical protein
MTFELRRAALTMKRLDRRMSGGMLGRMALGLRPLEMMRKLVLVRHRATTYKVVWPRYSWCNGAFLEDLFVAIICIY